MGASKKWRTFGGHFEITNLLGGQWRTKSDLKLNWRTFGGHGGHGGHCSHHVAFKSVAYKKNCVV